jgi:hypothetical protein
VSPVQILIVEDNKGDILLVKETAARAGFSHSFGRDVLAEIEPGTFTGYIAVVKAIEDYRRSAASA